MTPFGRSFSIVRTYCLNASDPSALRRSASGSMKESVASWMTPTMTRRPQLARASLVCSSMCMLRSLTCAKTCMQVQSSILYRRYCTSRLTGHGLDLQSTRTTGACPPPRHLSSLSTAAVCFAFVSCPSMQVLLTILRPIVCEQDNRTSHSRPPLDCDVMANW